MRLTLDQAASLLHIGRNKMTRTLRQRGVFDSTNKPQGRYAGAGYFVVSHKQYRHPTRGYQHYHRTLVTAAGVQMLQQLLEQCEEETSTVH